MKKQLLFWIIFVSFFVVNGQPPQKMSYQAVVRSSNNELVVNQQVGVRISIVKNNLNGLPIYVETHQVQTNHNGLMTIEVGAGVAQQSSQFADIDWADGTALFIKSDIDPTGGTNYQLTGGQQLITVPYAFYCGGGDYNNLSNRPPDGSNTGDLLYWNSSDQQWHTVPVGQTGQVLTLGPGGIPQWSPAPSGSGNSNLPNLIPTIVTDSITNITGYTLRVVATIVDQGSTGITSSGVCWSTTNPSPIIGNSHTADGSSTGSFTSFVDGLMSSTTYYFRAYATNSVGTAYGNVISITTPNHCGTVTDIDGNVYNTVYLGRQCWLKENLRTTRYADGVAITQAPNIATSSTDYSVCNPHALGKNNASCYYYPGHDASNVADRGLLYTWNAVMKGAGSSDNNPSGILGVCPYGWHVPSSSEWCELENFLNPGIDVSCTNTGMRGTMAKMMAKPQFWTNYTSNSYAPGYWQTDQTGFNSTDFSMVPTGYVYENNTYLYGCTYNSNNHTHYYYPFSAINNTAYFWTSSSGKYRYFSYNDTGSYHGTSGTATYAYAVRCVKDF